MATAYETFGLDELLGIAQRRFGDTSRGCFEFSLGRIAGRWRFDVVNSWYKWSRRGLTIHFEGDTPQEAVATFLAYVEANRIDVSGLTEAAPTPNEE